MSIARFARFEKMRHGDQRKIAIELDVNDSDVSKVMHDRVSDLAPEKVELIRKTIAKRFKMSYAECWPDVTDWTPSTGRR